MRRSSRFRVGHTGPGTYRSGTSILYRNMQPSIESTSTALAGGSKIVTISMHDASVGVFVPFLANLSALLDHAQAYAEERRIDPLVLLKMRLHPTMYNLA